MVLIILGVVFGAVALLAIAMAVRNHEPSSVLEKRLAALDLLLAQRGIQADVFVDTKPIEVAVRGSRAPEGRVSLDAGGVVPDALMRLGKRAPLWVRDGVLRVAVDDTGIEQWTDADVERIANDIYVVVGALQRRAAVETRELSRPQSIAQSPPPRPESDAEGSSTGAPIAVPLKKAS